MDFALEETPRAVRDLAADLLRREDANGAGLGGEQSAVTESVWKKLGEAGLLTLAVPERLGGSGLGALETAMVLTEIGRRTAAVPALATLAFGVLPLSRLGTDAQQDRLLPGVESGQILTAAMNEPSTPMPDTPRTVARRSGRELVVSGTKVNVLDAGRAHRILVSVALDEGVGVVLIDPGADGVSLTATPVSGAVSEYTVRFDEVRIAGSELLGATARQWVLDDLHSCALAGLCAVGDGALAGALDLTAEHLRTREQFGKALASFQAVSQQVADVYVVARTLNLATHSACWRLAGGYDAEEDLAVAALWLTDEVPPALHTCHHLHGGLGVDVTYPMHRHYSLIKDMVRVAGGARHRLEELADQCAEV